MKRIVFSLFLLAFIIEAFPASSYADEATFSPTARAAALYQPDTGVFLYEKNSRERLKMASTTKIMTALIAIESTPLDTLLTVPPEAAGTEGSSLYLSVGDTGTLRDFLYALMLASANDAAVTIATCLAGSVDAFAGIMNRRAKDMGLLDTHFENPHGLDAEEHYTTARDLAVLTAEAMNEPRFCELVSTEKKTIYLNGGETVRHLSNHNRLLRSMKEACGVKTGFTKASGRCLVSAAERDGVRVIAVTLDCPDDWREHTALLQGGLSSFEYTTLAKRKSIAFRFSVLGGTDSTLIASNPADIYAVIPKNADIETRFDTMQYLTAPIKKGDVVGKVSFYLDGKLIAESPLTAEATIDILKPKKHFFFF